MILLAMFSDVTTKWNIFVFLQLDALIMNERGKIGNKIRYSQYLILG